MKNLKLKDLSVKSFATTISNVATQTIKGGETGATGIGVCCDPKFQSTMGPTGLNFCTNPNVNTPVVTNASLVITCTKGG